MRGLNEVVQYPRGARRRYQRARLPWPDAVPAGRRLEAVVPVPGVARDRGAVEEAGRRHAPGHSGTVQERARNLAASHSRSRAQQNRNRRCSACSAVIEMRAAEGKWLNTNISGATTRRPISWPRSPARQSTPKTIVPKACCSPSCSSAPCRTRGSAHRCQRGARDARRQSDPHRRRSAGPAEGSPTSASHQGELAQRAGADQRAAIRGRADSGRRGRRRADRRRGDRADPRSNSSRCRSSSIRSRPATGRSECADRRERLVRVPAPTAGGRRAGAPRRRARIHELKWTEADFAAAGEGQLPMGEGRPTSGRSATSRPASRTPRSCSTRPSSPPTPAISRSKRAPRWPTGRTASCTCTARRRARRRPLPPSPAGSASSRATS